MNKICICCMKYDYQNTWIWPKYTYHQQYTNFLKVNTVSRIKTKSIFNFIFKISSRFDLFLCHDFEINEHIAKPTIKK